MIRKFHFLALLALGFTTGLHAAEPPKPLKVLLVLGGCCHDYGKQQFILSEGIAARANVEIQIEYSSEKGTKPMFPIYEKADWSKGFDVVIHDECAADVKDQAYIDNILNAHKAGLPAVALHCAMHSYRKGNFGSPMKPDSPDATWFNFLGMQSSGHGPQKPIALTFVDNKHPITIGMADWTTENEELYNNVHASGGDLKANFVNWPDAKPLIEGKQDAGDQPGKNHTVVAWTNLYGPNKTKVFGTTIGHNNKTIEDPRYLDLVTRGVLWVTGKITEDGKPAPGYEAKK
jgi:type 1 glutamine amidotransferase